LASIPAVPPWALIAAALLSATLFGRLMADGRMKYGVALVLAACYVPLVFFDITRALAVWVALLFFSDISVFSAGPNAVGVLLGLGWLGTFVGGRRAGLVRRQRRLLLVIAVFGLWVTLTIAWAGDPGAAGTEVGYWWLAALVFLLTLTTLITPQDVGRVAVAFVIGAVVSVIIGLATGGLTPSDTTAVTNTAIQGRFTGGGGDPNQQAAAFIAAMFMVPGLFGLYRRRLVRIGLVLAFTVIAIGFFATESRGGLIALVVASVAALALAPRQRKAVLGLLALVAVAGGILLASTPGALNRITNLGGGTSGRSDLWRVGWDVFTGHPVAGVGAGNFQVVEAHFALRPGNISRIQYISEEPHLVHNTYLQLGAEVGLVGLVLYLAIVFVCLRMGIRAAKRFDQLGYLGYADLSRAIVMGAIGMLVALFFISDGDDFLLWLLLALGPVMFGAASRLPLRAPPPPPPPAGDERTAQRVPRARLRHP
jgi:O-antigen ligase